jgi:peptide deformylase
MIKPIITNIKDLKRPCTPVAKNDNIKDILADLKDTLTAHPGGLGLSANQIDYDKAICYIKILIGIDPEKKPHYKEVVLINPKIIEKDNPIKVTNEGCLSFPGITVVTKRFIYITVEFLDENLKLQARSFQDYESLAIQHEIAHLLGLTIFDFKWKAK